MKQGDRMKLNLSTDEDIFMGLVDTWEAQTNLPAPKTPTELNEQEVTLGVVDLAHDEVMVFLDNGVEIALFPEELI